MERQGRQLVHVRGPGAGVPQSNVTSSQDGAAGLSLETYDSLPPDCQGAAQAIRNYHANVSVLVECETEEQKVTLRQICDQMHQQAVQQLALLAKDDKQNDHKAERLKAYTLQLQGDLDKLRHQQLQSQAQIRGLVEQMAATTTMLDGGDTDGDTADTNNDTAQKEELFGRKPATAAAAASSSPTTKKAASASSSPARASHQQQQQQDAHLAVLSASLGELGSIAGNLQSGLAQQSNMMDNLDGKAEQLHETSQMVGRRADRLVQTKSQQQQDAHLAVLSASLGELGSIAGNLQSGLAQQSNMMDNLDGKAEQLHETSQMVGRRADRLVQTKSWTPAKAVFVGHFGLRHVATGKYLACLHSELFLVNQFNPTSCTFGVHQRSSTGGGGTAASSAVQQHHHGGTPEPRQPQVDGTELFDGSAAVRGRQPGTPRRVSIGRKQW